jgi:hypothetical protein
MTTYAATMNGKPLTQRGYKNGDFLKALLAPQKGVVRPGVPAPAAPTAPVTPGAPAPAAPPAPTAPDPLDSTYNNGITALKNSRSGAYADLARAHTYAQQDHDDQTGQLVKQRVAQLINEKNAAAQRGLFYSSFLTNRNRDVNTAVDDQQTAVENAFTRGEAQRASDLTTLQNTYGLDGSDAYGTAGTQLFNEAVGRAIAAQAAAAPPPAPAPVAAPAVAPAPAAPAAPAVNPHGTPTITPGKDSHGNPGSWHTYPDGRKVFVKR